MQWFFFQAACRISIKSLMVIFLSGDLIKPQIQSGSLLVSENGKWKMQNWNILTTFFFTLGVPLWCRCEWLSCNQAGLTFTFLFQSIDYEGFQRFLRTYLEAEDISPELCKRLFMSFQAAPSGTGEEADGAKGELQNREMFFSFL